MSFKMLQADVLRWADDKDLLHSENADKQFMKFIEEVFEFKSEFDKYIDKRESLKKSYNSYEILKLEEIKERMELEYGDILITLIILSYQIGIDSIECLDMAYDKIKDRKGKTINGQFIKEEDL